MKFGVGKGKKLIAMLLAVSMFVTVLPVTAYAELVGRNNVFGITGALPVYEPFSEEPFPNGGGYWDSHQLGYRFSLVDKSGVSLKTVDVFDLTCIVGVNQPINKTILDRDGAKTNYGVHGTIYDILTDKIKNVDGITLEDEAQYRIFNKCKTEVVNLSVDELKNSCITTDPIVVAPDNEMDYYDKWSDSYYKWYCADVRTVFRNTKLKDLDRETDNYFVRIHESVETIEDDQSSIQAWVIPDSIDKFICNNITGRPRETLTQNSFDPTENAWIGMCDLLRALGLKVYEGVIEGKWDNRQNLEKLYNNLVSLFVVPEYCIVVEPVLFSGVALYYKGYDDEGNVFFQRDRTSVYYGSITELGILEAKRWVYNKDKGLYSKKNNYIFEILHLAVFTTCLGQQCAYVTEDYAYELKKCSMDGVLKTVSLDNFEKWRIDCKKQYKDLVEDYKDQYKNEYDTMSFTSYDAEIMKDYAIGMAIIVSTDFIKPQIETDDSEYRAGTNVVTSLKVSNRSSTAYTTMLDSESMRDSTRITPDTVLNANGVPKAMLCKFTVSKISDESGDYGRWTADKSAITTLYQQKLEELGFAKDSEGNYITEFYGSLDGIMPREYSDEQPPCYVSFNWKTPEKPCKVTFEVEFLNANSKPEAVLGTAEHEGHRATEIKNTNGIYSTEFFCEISDEVNKTLFTEDTLPPDSVSIISVSPDAAPDSDEQILYDLNKDIYDAYRTTYGTSAALYTGTDFMGRTINDSRSWSEYVASYDASGTITLTHNPHTVSAGVSKTTDLSFTDNTSEIMRTDQSGLYSDYADSIGSGYGIGIDFISSFSSDGTGDDYSRDIVVNGTTYENKLVTNFDHGVVMFPEYNYRTYFGELLKFDTDADLVGRSAESRYMLTANCGSKFYNDKIKRPIGMTDEEYAVYAEMSQDEKSRVHFTPVWYPDGTYQIVLCMFDAWTPAGQLWFYKTYDIDIKGSIYDTWYVTRTHKNQVVS